MTREQATVVVDSIIRDLRDRSGLDSEWASIDATTQEEIRATWISIVMNNGRESA